MGFFFRISREFFFSVLTDLKPPKGYSAGSCEELEIELAQLVDGFLFMVDSNGLISYISQGVSSSLGLTQVG